ncbi:LOW QUALITY PROTEIN: noggin-1-like [Xyrichtys novacula]|uniref:LOW QUALITY PROTEIN: noggin-1-like n=1 Tax=Xyrichtys novacula TaxID=13765 RepID=A0AAV1EYR4_XYRNO|nr:LOW QUALITY PROTEIN: noggin-1-like [Xyrichtys novacula]
MSGAWHTESLDHPEENSKQVKREARETISYSPVPSTKPRTMPRLLNYGVCLCWIYVSLLHGSAECLSSNLTQNQLPNVTLFSEEDKGRDSSFLQLRASIPSYFHPIRPYTLLTSTEDSRYMPKPRHRRPAHLLRLLGPSFDQFWMSIEEPSDASGGHEGKSLIHGDSLPDKLSSKSTAGEKFNLSASPELREAAANHRQRLEKEAADLNLSSLPSHVARHVRNWLAQSAACELSYQWVDLGPAFWPRWLRQTDCRRSDGVSCSFPSGMECVRADTTHIRILVWNCLEIRGRGDGSKTIKNELSDGGTEVVTSEVTKRCSWRQVPYPVVTACKCSCR